MDRKKMKIEDLGFDAFFESHRLELGLDLASLARVTTEGRGVYRVKNASGEYRATISGKQVFRAVSREDYPAVGDFVSISVSDPEQAVIVTLLPRKTIMKRRQGGGDETQIIATNIDVALVVESVDRDYSVNRLERYFSIARDGGIRPALVLNKVDLLSKEALKERLAYLRERFGDTDIILTSTFTDEGLDDLKQYIVQGKTYCFLGSSGVGKSSLINKLLGKSVIKTGEIGEQSGRGRHVTTARAMYFLDNGGIVIDNPGVREVGMTDVASGVDGLFEEITTLGATCKFTDCSHVEEPGCAVLFAVQSGTLDRDRYRNYLTLKKEAVHYGMTKFQKKEKDRQFGKFVKKVKKDLREYSEKDYFE